MIGFSRADGTLAGNQSGAKQFCAGISALLRCTWEFRSSSDGIHSGHTYSTLLRSVGTEFKVMQELLRHSSLRSTLDIYTQAISPAKHEAQAAVLSLVFSSDTSESLGSTTQEAGAM